MKRGIVLVVVLCLLLIGFVSAGWWSDLYTKITGKVSEVGIPGEDYTGCTGLNGEAYGPDDTRCFGASPTPSSSSGSGTTGNAYVPPYSKDPQLICTRTLIYVAIGSGPVYETTCRKEVSYAPVSQPDICKEKTGKRKFCKPQRLIMDSNPTPVDYYTNCETKNNFCKPYYTTTKIESCPINVIDCSQSKYAECAKCANCAPTPQIENAEFSTETAMIKNQPWYNIATDSPEKPACTWWCKEGYVKQLVDIPSEDGVTGKVTSPGESSSTDKKYVCVKEEACTDNDGDYYAKEEGDVWKNCDVCGPNKNEACQGGSDCDDINPSKQRELFTNCISLASLNLYKKCDFLYSPNLFYSLTDARTSLKEGQLVSNFPECNLLEIKLSAYKIISREEALKLSSDFDDLSLKDEHSFLIASLSAKAMEIFFTEEAESLFKSSDTRGAQILRDISSFVSSIPLDTPQKTKAKLIYEKLQEIITIDLSAGKFDLKTSLECGVGVCKHTSFWLTTFLNRVGIDSSILISAPLKNKPGHVWTRVQFNDGTIIDLDPTWFASYFELPIREKVVSQSADISLKLSGNVINNQDDSFLITHQFCSFLNICENFSSIYLFSNTSDNFDFSFKFQDSFHRIEFFTSEDISFFPDSIPNFYANLFNKNVPVYVFNRTNFSLVITGMNLSTNKSIIFVLAYNGLIDLSKFNSIIKQINAFLPETFCDGIDDNENGVIDEGCDQDRDGYVNKDMTCEGSFYSENNLVKVSAENVPSKINFIKGWNSVSFPTINSVPSDDLISSCRANGGIVFNTTSNQYYVEQEMSAGKAYWIYASKDCEFDISKYGIKNNFEIEMQQGWNFVPGFSNLNEVYPKQSIIWVYTPQGYSRESSASIINGVWVYWDSQKLLTCSRVDKDDLNSEMNK